MTTDRDLLRAQLQRHEGVRRRPYLDCCGKYWRDCTCVDKGQLTIGVGRNLDAVPLSDDEIDLFESHDIDRAVRALSVYPWFAEMDPVRQAALTNVMFNLGPGTFAEFERMIAALSQRRYSVAADELLDSKAAKQTGVRYHELAAQLRVGAWMRAAS